MPDDSPHVSPFARIRHEDERGGEYWSARELAEVLGYPRWQKFQEVIKRAMQACENSGFAPADHFTHAGKMVPLGSGAERKIEDFHLSRYAGYLVIENGDPSKEIVALGQTYFAVRTREAELADELAGLTEEQRRLRLRPEMAAHNTSLTTTLQASIVGPMTAKDFALFHDHGYRGLYNGETARDIAARKGVKPGTILDWMGSEELAANLFRATQAEAKLRREHITDKSEANRAHLDVGRKVRQTIAELGGTMPEDLPTPAESIQQLHRQEQQRLVAERQPSLFEEEP
jgi:DNA-damage-inducible protein D